ncbi:MAG TPA: rhodanese-like domain-containing protein [Geobacter sp.]|nr:rhodanese-like domain-containing protein [Geobacter sp.]
MEQKELLRRMKKGDPPAIVDVRTGMEYHRGHIPGAIHAPTWKIMLFMAPLPSDKRTEMVLLCELGPRAAIAKSLLGFLGYRNTTLLEGHMSAWRRASLPMAK